MIDYSTFISKDSMNLRLASHLPRLSGQRFQLSTDSPLKTSSLRSSSLASRLTKTKTQMQALMSKV